MMKQTELKDRLKEALDLCDKKAVDLSNDLGIPKSAISQYLSGKTKKMDAGRIYSIAEYLNVSDAWLMGYDAPMERHLAKIEADPVGEANKLADWYLNLEMKEENSIMLEEFIRLDEQKQAQAREFIHFLSGRN